MKHIYMFTKVAKFSESKHIQIDISTRLMSLFLKFNSQMNYTRNHLFSAWDNNKCNKKRITSYKEFRLVFASVSPRKTETRSFPAQTESLLSRGLFPSRLPFCLCDVHARESHTDVYRSIQTSSFYPRLHYDTTFKLVVAHPPIVRSPRRAHHPTARSTLDAYLRRGYFSMEDSTSIRYILANTLPGVAEQYAHECITPTPNPPGSTGIYAIVIYDIANYFRKRVRKCAVVALNF